MSYWTQSRWTITVKPASKQSIIEPELPFALIGSHERCQVKLAVRHMEPVSYFACCFDDKIEVWPLSPVAFPRWGIVGPNTDVLVGRHRLQFRHTTGPAQVAQPIDSSGGFRKESRAQELTSEVELTLAWGETQVAKKIVRSVTIIGDGHPAVLRAHGRGMQRCDHAIVVSGQRVWLVDLHPCLETKDQEMIHELQRDGMFYRVNDMRISIGPAETECPASIARQARVARAGANSVANPQSFPSNMESSRETESVNPDSKHESTTIASEEAIELVDQTEELEGFDCPELLTSHVTDRLIGQNRFTKQKLLSMAGTVSISVLVVLFLFWLFWGRLNHS